MFQMPRTKFICGCHHQNSIGCCFSTTTGRAASAPRAIKLRTRPRRSISPWNGKQAKGWRSARALAIRELLLQRGRLVGIVPILGRDSAGRCETEEEALIRGLLEQEVRTPEPDEETCRRYYAKNRRLFSSQSIYEAAHILFAAHKEDAQGYERARRDAAAALAELKLNPERFGDFARTCSACPSAAQAGNLGQITAGQTTPEFERALATLTPGSISQEPVETRYGIHIIRLGRKVEGRELPSSS